MGHQSMPHSQSALTAHTFTQIFSTMFSLSIIRTLVLIALFCAADTMKPHYPKKAHRTVGRWNERLYTMQGYTEAYWADHAADPKCIPLAPSFPMPELLGILKQKRFRPKKWWIAGDDIE